MFLFALTEATSRRKDVFGSQFEGRVHYGGEGKAAVAAVAADIWSHVSLVRKQRDERWHLARSSFYSVQVLSPM